MYNKNIPIVLKIVEIISNLIISIKKDKTGKKGEKTNDQSGSDQEKRTIPKSESFPS